METQTKIALVQGASRGLGLEFVRQLAARADIERVIATCRQPETAKDLAALAVEGVSVYALDVESEDSIEAAAAAIASATPRLDLLINCAGLLHDGAGLMPERRLATLNAANFQRSFAVNAIGPALVVKELAALLRAGDRPLVANLSARVGSITDNRLGGWYAYRAAKAAQNMLTRCLAIELGRGGRPVRVVALHPGTVDTELSKPFQRGVPEGKLFSVNNAVKKLLKVIDNLDVADTGSFYAWDGSPIPW
ncbi:MAG: SDR family oxidoreductase [Pseudomonadota bacterium]